MTESYPLPLGFISKEKAITDVPSVFYTARLLDIGRGAWRETLADYVLFTPALLYLGVNDNLSLFENYEKDTGNKVEPLFVASNKPLFVGLMSAKKQPQFNHTLFCVPKADWPALDNWIRTLVFVNRAAGVVTKARIQNIFVRDDAAWEASLAATELPERLPAVGVVLETNKGSIYFVSEKENNPLQLVQSKFDPTMVYQDTVDLVRTWDNLFMETGPWQ